MKLTTFKYFYPENPRLLSIEQPLFQRLSDHNSFIAEKKFNEQRLELHCNGSFEFWNRHEEKLNYTPNEELLDALNRVPLHGYCQFDGGLRHNKVPGIKHKIMIYDVFIWQGKLLIGKPFWYRRTIIENLFQINGDPLGIPEQFPNNFHKVFFDVIKNDPEIEGLVIKNKAGILKLGRNSAYDSNWMWKVRKPSGRYAF